MEDLLAVEIDAEDDWDLRDIVPSGAIDIRTSLHGDFSAIQEKSRLCGLDVPANTGGVFRTALPD